MMPYQEMCRRPTVSQNLLDQTKTPENAGRVRLKPYSGTYHANLLRPFNYFHIDASLMKSCCSSNSTSKDPGIEFHLYVASR